MRRKNTKWLMLALLAPMPLINVCFDQHGAVVRAGGCRCLYIQA